MEGCADRRGVAAVRERVSSARAERASSREDVYPVNWRVSADTVDTYAAMAPVYAARPPVYTDRGDVSPARVPVDAARSDVSSAMAAA
jgi:hypothetical protein